MPGLNGEAWLIKGLLALQYQQPQQAILPLMQASSLFTKRADVQALLIRALLQTGHTDIARRVLDDRLIQFPDDATLLQFYTDITGERINDAPTSSHPGAAENNTDFVAPAGAPHEAMVDVLVPVYKGYDETLACLESVLRYRTSNQTPHEIIVLDDASPDAALQQKLAQLAEAGHITYIRRPANLGFIGNMNRGMALHPGRDVVWLNADTCVHGNWLDRLHDAAYSAENVASVTPFSNNGLVMSVPEMLDKAPMPTDAEHIALDQLAALLNQPAVQIPSGCGFCFYLRRDAINDVGYLDEAHLTRGYEEETDWCQRAHNQGWQHLGATNLFVAHRGGVSFGIEKAQRVQQNGRILRRRYPTFKGRWQRFLAQDPLKPARSRLLQSVETTRPRTPTPALQTLPCLSISTLLANQTPAVWLIGDDLQQADIAQRWLQLARAITRQALPCTLLLAERTPHEVLLSRTGAVCTLPTTRGITRDEAIKLAGAQACLCLGEPSADTAAFAARNHIPMLRLQ